DARPPREPLQGLAERLAPLALRQREGIAGRSAGETAETTGGDAQRRLAVVVERAEPAGALAANAQLTGQFPQVEARLDGPDHGPGILEAPAALGHHEPAAPLVSWTGLVCFHINLDVRVTRPTPGG